MSSERSEQNVLYSFLCFSFFLFPLFCENETKDSLQQARIMGKSHYVDKQIERNWMIVTKLEYWRSCTRAKFNCSYFLNSHLPFPVFVREKNDREVDSILIIINCWSVPLAKEYKRKFQSHRPHSSETERFRFDIHQLSRDEDHSKSFFLAETRLRTSNWELT